MQPEGRKRGYTKKKWMYNEDTFQDLKHFKSVNESMFSTKN